MQVVPHLAFDVFLCLAYQIDLYFLSVLHLFGKEEDYHQLFSECLQDLKGCTSDAMPADEVVSRF